MVMNGSHAAFRLAAGGACLVVLAGLVVTSAMAAAIEPITIGMARLLQDPWGLPSLLDLAASLLVIGTWMCLVEARPRRLWFWLPLLACLGNITTAIFLLARLRRTGNLRAWLTERM
jgi:hypothetical protein